MGPHPHKGGLLQDHPQGQYKGHPLGQCADNLPHSGGQQALIVGKIKMVLGPQLNYIQEGQKGEQIYKETSLGIVKTYNRLLN